MNCKQSTAPSFAPKQVMRAHHACPRKMCDSKEAPKKMRVSQCGSTTNETQHETPPRKKLLIFFGQSIKTQRHHHHHCVSPGPRQHSAPLRLPQEVYLATLKRLLRILARHHTPGVDAAQKRKATENKNCAPPFKSKELTPKCVPFR